MAYTPVPLVFSGTSTCGSTIPLPVRAALNMRRSG
jgi:hypothetical protein